ncbi:MULTISPECIES: hypothetical protein [unclassified Mycolicibacterium]|nr:MULTISPECIES: hypothetical protein [unclassified Mycolicibacterium]
MTWRVVAVAAGAVAGLAIFSGAFAVWMVFGADPDQDPVFSW